MQSAEEGWSTTEAPLASPSDYFDAEFVPEMNRAYRIWLRLRGGGDSLSSDSVWVQFSGSVDSDGAPLYRIGSTAALLVNLAACSDCGISSWDGVIRRGGSINRIRSSASRHRLPNEYGYRPGKMAWRSTRSCSVR